MRNPFPKNPVFSEFLGIKDAFRQYTTKENVRKTKELSRLAREMSSLDQEIAFDILGSINFGMAIEKSDVDMVLYLDCGHDEEATYENTHKLWFYEHFITNHMTEAIDREKSLIQLVDYINLRRLRKALNNEIQDEDIIARFVFYRTICRGVNKKVIRSYEQKILQDSQLLERIENQLSYALIEFTKTSSHIKSFKKYVDRLKEENVYIPPSMFEKIMKYLNSQI